MFYKDLSVLSVLVSRFLGLQLANYATGLKWLDPTSLVVTTKCYFVPGKCREFLIVLL